MRTPPGLLVVPTHDRAPFVGASTTANPQAALPLTVRCLRPLPSLFIVGTAPRVPKGYRESQFPQSDVCPVSV